MSDRDPDYEDMIAQQQADRELDRIEEARMLEGGRQDAIREYNHRELREYVLPPHGTLILPGHKEISALRHALKQYSDDVLWEFLEKTGTCTYQNAEVMRLLVKQALSAKAAADAVVKRAALRELCRRGVRK
jgi:hypothetical protein